MEHTPSHNRLLPLKTAYWSVRICGGFCALYFAIHATPNQNGCRKTSFLGSGTRSVNHNCTRTTQQHVGQLHTNDTAACWHTEACPKGPPLGSYSPRWGAQHVPQNRLPAARPTVAASPGNANRIARPNCPRPVVSRLAPRFERIKIGRLCPT